MTLPAYINFEDSNFWIACLCIIFNPIYWNALARWEYRTKWLSRLVGGPYVGCCLLAFSIVALGIYRDWRYQLALHSQPSWWFLRQNFYLWSGHGLVVLGCVLVVTSFWKLGLFGTFLGDYFGILLSDKVTGFPFSIVAHPMYMGSFFNFLGIALIQASQAGLVLSAVVFIMYQIAISLEEPFTEMIYENLEEYAASAAVDEDEAESEDDEHMSEDKSSKKDTSKINSKLS